MNRSKLAKMRYFRVKLRPLAQRRNVAGRWLPAKDDVWIVMEANKKMLKLQNNLGHNLKLSLDAIHDFRFARVTDFDETKEDIFKLLGFAWICGDRVEFEPLSLVVAEDLFLRQIGLMTVGFKREVRGK